MCLILLDLSVTFDTISHKLLLNRLKHHFGITDLALLWIEDYLTDRVQRVVVITECSDRAESANKPLNQGIPHDSVLGVVLFTLYVSPLGNICQNYSVFFHVFADDSQICLSFIPSIQKSKEICLQNLQACVNDI